MKTFVVFACLLLVQFKACKAHKEESDLAVVAIRELLTKYFVENCPKIDLLIVGNDAATESIANDLLRWMPPEISLQVTKREDWTDTALNTSSILLCDKITFKEKIPQMEFVDPAGVFHKHLVYAPGLTADDIIMNLQNNSIISEVNFLINNDNKSIELATAFLFTRETCHVYQVKTINRFTSATKQWNNTIFYPDKYLNFYGCPIKVKYIDDWSNVVSTNVFKTLAEQLNFKLKRQLVDNVVELDMLDKNNTMTETISAQDTEMGMLSSAIIFDDLTFVVSPGKPLTDLERMFAAFDNETWIGIGATFVVALAVILFIKFMPIEVQNFVFGRNIRTPILNLFSNFLTGGQNRVPGRNFARYMLTMWCLWCMIFRTCYQSKMFEHMNSDMRHQRIRTIDELVEKNFTLVYEEAEWFERFVGFNINNSIHFQNNVSWYNNMPEPANKMAFYTFRSHYFQHVVTKIGNTQPSTYILDENLLTLPFYLAMPIYVPYTRIFKEKIDQMLSSGLIQKWHADEWNTKTSKRRYTEEVEPQVLTVESLHLGFLAFLLALAVSGMVFCIETAINFKYRLGSIFQRF